MTIITDRPDTWPNIEGKRLEESDLERNVTFTYRHGERVHGKLSSFRPNGAVFVRFKGPTGERCDPEQLTWG